jgi:hypothetical protein
LIKPFELTEVKKSVSNRKGQRMSVFKLFLLILIVCILGILVKITKETGDGFSTSQDTGLVNYQTMSTNAPEFAVTLLLPSEQSLTGSTGEK